MQMFINKCSLMSAIYSPNQSAIVDISCFLHNMFCCEREVVPLFVAGDH